MRVLLTLRTWFKSSRARATRAAGREDERWDVRLHRHEPAERGAKPADRIRDAEHTLPEQALDKRRALVCCLAALCLSAAGAGAEPLRDARGRPVTPSDASRIVSIGSSVTETLYALGLEERIVAVDTTSTFPDRVRSKPNVGYMRALSPEGVLSLDPTLIVAVEGSGPPEVVTLLERSTVPFVLVPDPKSLEGALAKIALVARAVGKEEEGSALAAVVRQDAATLAGMLRPIEKRRRALFVLAMRDGSPVTAGENTSAEAMLELAGATNALTGFAGFKPVSAEAVMMAEPDAVVLMSERAHDIAPDALLASPAFADTPAAREHRVVALGGAYLLGFGPRIAHAARDLAAALYPERNLPPLPERPWTRGLP